MIKLVPNRLSMLAMTVGLALLVPGHAALAQQTDSKMLQASPDQMSSGQIKTGKGQMSPDQATTDKSDAPSPTQQPPVDWQKDYAIWKEVKATDSIEAYEIYLKKFPQGEFADLARIRIKALNDDATVIKDTPDTANDMNGQAGQDQSTGYGGTASMDGQSGGQSQNTSNTEQFIAAGPGDEAIFMSRIEAGEAQGRLTSLGYDTLGVDGSLGPKSRFAIRLWQQDNKLPATGYLNWAQFELLRRLSQKSYDEWANGGGVPRALRYGNHDQPGPVMSDKDSRAFSQFD